MIIILSIFAVILLLMTVAFIRILKEIFDDHDPHMFI